MSGHNKADTNTYTGQRDLTLALTGAISSDKGHHRTGQSAPGKYNTREQLEEEKTVMKPIYKGNKIAYMPSLTLTTQSQSEVKS